MRLLPILLRVQQPPSAPTPSPWVHALRHTVTMGVMLSLLLPSLTWAFEPSTWAHPEKIKSTTLAEFNIPSHLAHVTRSTSGAPLQVIHIQDLHCQYETQANLARLLDYLQAREHISLVLVEGASQPINVTKLSTFPLPEVRHVAGDYFMRLGRMSGAEYYAATAKQPPRLEGIEDEGLYQAERRCLTHFLTYESQNLMVELRDQFNHLKPGIYSAHRLNLDHYALGYEEGSLSTLQYGRALEALARAFAPNSANAYPELKSFLAQNKAELSPEGDSETLTQQLKS